VLQFCWAAEIEDNKSTEQTTKEHVRLKRQAMVEVAIVQHKTDEINMGEVGWGALFVEEPW
jgi:hypothetical protein